MKSKKLRTNSDLHCGSCGKEFKYASERRRHEQSHSPQFECKVCSKKFSFLSALRRHEKQHERTGNVVCTECNRMFRDESLLKRHIKYAHKGSFTCSKCEATFSSDLALRSHAKTHRPVSERKYRCSFHGCSKSFNFSHHLKHHELTHTNMKQHYCNVCGKGFIQSHHLKSHKKTHEPENWFICDISGCKKSFPTEYARKKHFATHHRKDNLEDNLHKNNTSCDITDLIEPDTVKCASCKQIILGRHYAEHLNNCFVINELRSDRDTPKEDDKALTKLEPVKIEFNDKRNCCKSFVGECILGDLPKINDKCLCAEISAALPADDCNYELTASDNSNTEVYNEPAKPNTSDKIDLCEGCDCASSFKSENADVGTKTSNSREAEIVEYRTDGTIKIKEAFDLDIKTCRKGSVDLVPYSCKAVLGNCIVSGNGTIGEGCLCAKMANDDEQLMTQEIEALTPCPTS